MHATRSAVQHKNKDMGGKCQPRCRGGHYGFFYVSSSFLESCQYSRFYLKMSLNFKNIIGRHKARNGAEVILIKVKIRLSAELVHFFSSLELKRMPLNTFLYLRPIDQ